MESAAVGICAGLFVGLKLSRWAFPRLEVEKLVGRSWILHPVDGLVVVHDVHVRKLEHVVQESREGVFIFLPLKPCRVEVKAEGCSVGVIASLEVVSEHLKDVVSVQVGRALIGINARHVIAL